MLQTSSSSVIALFSVLACSVAVAATTAITNVNVIPMTSETVLDDHVVEIEDGRITAIYPSDELDGESADESIDGDGGYLYPAMSDLHIHFFGGSGAMETFLRMYIANGVAHGLCMQGSRSLLKVRDKIRAGEEEGPLLWISSPIIGNFSPRPVEYGEGREIAEKYQDMGYDYIKVYNLIPEDGYRGIMDEANKLGMPVVGHAVRSVGIEGAIENHQHIAHIEEFIYGYFREDLDESKIPVLAKELREADIGVITTLIAFHNIIRQIEDLDAMLAGPGVDLMPDSILSTWARDKNEYLTRPNQDEFEKFLRPTYAFMEKVVKGLQEGGVTLLAGTDAMIPVVVPGYSLHDELADMVAAGLTPYEALVTATRAPGEFLKSDVPFGTIAPGMEASVVLTSANPLEDIGNTKKIRGVMIRGQWYGPSDIEALLASPAE